MALAALSIDLEARLAKLQEGLDKAGRIAEKDAARMARAFDKVRAAAVGIGSALVAGISVGAVTQFVKGSIDGADAAIKQARSVGVLVEEITALNYAAELSGISQEELSAGLTRLARQAKDAGDGVKESAQVFKQLGISVKDSDGQLKGTSQLLAEVSDQFARLPAGVEKTALAVDVFGRSGAKLISLLDGGSAGLESMRSEAKRLGLVLGTEAAEAAERLNDNLTRLQKQSDRLGNSLAAVVVPRLNDVIVRINAAATSFKSVGEFISASLSEEARAGLGPAEAIESLTTKLSEFRLERDRIAASGGIFSALGLERLDGKIADAEKLLAYYRLVASQLASPAVAVGSENDPRRGRGFVAPQVGGLAGINGKPSAADRAAAKFAEEQRALALLNPARVGDDQFDSESARLARFNDELDRTVGLRERLEQFYRDQGLITGNFNESEAETARLKRQNDDLAAGVLASIEKIDDRTKLFLDNVQNAFGDTLLKTLKGDFDNIGKAWGDLILQMIAQAAAADFAAALGFGGSKGGNLAQLGGNFLNLLGGLFGGGRAIGGPGRRGQIIEVNEYGGPGELFSAGGKQYLLPSMDGHVTPVVQRQAVATAKAGPTIHIDMRPIINMDASMDQGRTTQMVAAAMAQSQEAMWRQLRARGLA